MSRPQTFRAFFRQRNGYSLARIGEKPLPQMIGDMAETLADWADAIAATVRQPAYRHLDDEGKQRLRELHEAGESMTRIADELGISRKCAHEHAVKLGLPTRVSANPRYRRFVVPEAHRAAYNKIRSVLGVDEARKQLDVWRASNGI